MSNIPPRLQVIADQIAAEKTPEPETVRSLLKWFDSQRRGTSVVKKIRQTLRKLKIRTEPDFESAYIDAYIKFIPDTPIQNRDATPQGKGEENGSSNSQEMTSNADDETLISAAIADPTYRISKLASANNPPVSVKPEAELQEAITLMIANDFSQLPVMQTERDVKGIITWVSIGSRLALGVKSNKVKDYMEIHQEINWDTSIFATIPIIVQYQYVLVRNFERKICGIVTATDLSLQFKQLAEPFLLVGEVENHIRRIIDKKFSKSEIAAAKDPADGNRKIDSVSDLTFGEYIRLLESQDGWDKLGLAIDRRTFITQLNKVRLIRNDTMHFDPDGLPETDLDELRKFVKFLQTLRDLKVV